MDTLFIILEIPDETIHYSLNTDYKRKIDMIFTWLFNPLSHTTTNYI